MSFGGVRGASGLPGDSATGVTEGVTPADAFTPSFLASARPTVRMTAVLRFDPTPALPDVETFPEAEPIPAGGMEEDSSLFEQQAPSEPATLPPVGLTHAGASFAAGAGRGFWSDTEARALSAAELVCWYLAPAAAALPGVVDEVVRTARAILDHLPRGPAPRPDLVVAAPGLASRAAAAFAAAGVVFRRDLVAPEGTEDPTHWLMEQLEQERLRAVTVWHPAPAASPGS